VKRSNTGDDVFVRAAPGRVFRMIESLPRDAAWWPGARVQPVQPDVIRVRVPSFRRGSRAVRFVARVERVRPGVGLVWQIDRGEVRGTGEWWLEPVDGGVVVHYLLDVAPGTRGRLRRWSSRVRRHRWAVRRGLNALKDRLERAGAAQHV
jgi:hypothetical protein